MPTYQYKCDECGIVFDRFQHFSEEPVRVCPECGAAVRRVIQPVGIIFKGKGFYVTDNRANTSALMPKSEKTEAGESAAKETKEAKETKAPAAKASSEGAAADTAKPAASTN
jgi:putative FmdB family regulatory protein